MLIRARATADEDEALLQLRPLEEDPLKQCRSINERDSQVADDDFGVHELKSIQCSLTIFVGVDDIPSKDPADHVSDGGLVLHQKDRP